MLKIKIPSFCVSEIQYTCFVVFTEWLGIEYELTQSEHDYILISFAEKELRINADFFIKASSDWLGKTSIPTLPLKWYNLNKVKTRLSRELHICENEMPVLYGIPEIKFNENSIDCGIDILGGIFFMISRYEEIVIQERDSHSRFLAKSSIAHKENFLFRPVANEYLELLFALLKHLFPQTVRSERQFQICPTHDIDIPFAFLHNSNYRIIKGIAGDFLKRRSLALASATYSAWKKFRKFGFQSDLYYCFDFIMNESEKRNLKSAFYFLPSSSPEMLRKYPVTDFEMQSLLQSIDKRGHEIGIHGFYGTYLNGKAFKDDVNLLQNTLYNLGINRKVRGGRQHYLQWQNPETFNVWENAGMEYDSTLSFADMPGFRCGTCYEYSVYDCIKRKKLNLKEKPLIAMECSIIAERYMNLGLSDEALKIFKALKTYCKYYNGNFIILFHNTEFITNAQKEFYQKVLDC
ncbi:polysaccharide deacetylase family protein [Treponema pedis]|uniref:polysaccharide deacetylase family protein n=1 Tax=Treponema pedis TaxID=409322 RepID=UPI003133FF70